jgi:hypothetical protein
MTRINRTFDAIYVDDLLEIVNYTIRIRIHDIEPGNNSEKLLSLIPEICLKPEYDSMLERFPMNSGLFSSRPSGEPINCAELFIRRKDLIDELIAAKADSIRDFIVANARVSKIAKSVNWFIVDVS